MFWGAMTRHSFGPLSVVDGTINGDSYLQLLNDFVLPKFEAAGVPLIYQHDNAPAHKKANVTAFLAQQTFENLNWPPQSPDLSPIEWIWNDIKMKMKALQPRPRTPAAMRDAIFNIWDNLDYNCREKHAIHLESDWESVFQIKGVLPAFKGYQKKVKRVVILWYGKNCCNWK
jgi:transposase